MTRAGIASIVAGVLLYMSAGCGSRSTGHYKDYAFNDTINGKTVKFTSFYNLVGSTNKTVIIDSVARIKKTLIDEYKNDLLIDYILIKPFDGKTEEYKSSSNRPFSDSLNTKIFEENQKEFNKYFEIIAQRKLAQATK